MHERISFIVHHVGISKLKPTWMYLHDTKLQSFFRVQLVYSILYFLLGAHDQIAYSPSLLLCLHCLSLTGRFGLGLDLCDEDDGISAFEVCMLLWL